MQDSAARPFRLLLLRHARSGWALPGQRDFDRALDDVGFAEAELIAEMAADRGIRPDLILCSTAVRCRQTAEPFFRAVGEDIAIRYVDELYTGPASIYTDIVDANRHLNSLMIVGHNPMIDELFHRLAGSEAATAALPHGYPPAALAILDVQAGSGGTVTATLVSLMLPTREPK